MTPVSGSIMSTPAQQFVGQDNCAVARTCLQQGFYQIPGDQSEQTLVSLLECQEFSGHLG